ncbi:MAG: bifunctional DNA-formamidopyrimidine glycosylase/DNA-(apurinic or apyrimidinic site) lyase [Acidimicrobiales bacterium]
MPELPEVETVRRGLEAVIPGRTVTRLQVTGKRTVRRQPVAELVDRLTGRRFGQPDRRGKYLVLRLDDDQVLVVHLRMSGQLTWVGEPASVPTSRHTHVVAALDDGSELRFVDPRTFGEWFVTAELDGHGMPAALAGLGPDPLVDGVGVRVLRERLGGKRALKAALTDQRVIAGIGSIYSDEICHAAQLRPDHRVDDLGPDELRRLARHTNAVLSAAVRLRGSSLRDASYRDLMGALGRYQSSHRVYDRAGEPCPRCGHEISRIKFGARSAYCCESCQV